MTSTLLVRVRARRVEADGVISIELVCASGERLPEFTAGAHINLHLPGGMRRSYSLHNQPGVDDHYAIAVGRAPASRGGSQWIHEHLDVGTTLEINPPRNNFPLVDDADVILIAGGIGITPLLSMARVLAESERPWQLHYAVQTRKQAAFVPTLRSLAEGSSGEFHLHVVDESGGDLIDLDGIVRGAGPLAHVYCCGPEGMLDAFEATATALGERAHTERFAAASVEVADDLGSRERYQLHLARSGRSFEIAREESILTVLKDAGVAVNWSCEEGTCGSCELRVLAGAVLHRDTVLSAQEQADSATMMVCVSRAAGESLTLDV
ncbi:hypothetical protein GQ85_08255 [Rhodococcus rhodochrous]|nr:hypothetical protein GQ85_08255 [Rhodococcus rhodochrous]